MGRGRHYLVMSMAGCLVLLTVQCKRHIFPFWMLHCSCISNSDTTTIVRFKFMKLLIFFTTTTSKHLHPIMLPLVPCSFWGVPQWLVPSPFLGGHPSPRWGYPNSRQGDTPGGVPTSQVRMGYPLARTGVPPPPARSGWVPQPGLGYPWPGQDGVPPSARTGWSAPSQLRIRYPQWPGLGYPPARSGWGTRRTG